MLRTAVVAVGRLALVPRADARAVARGRARSARWPAIPRFCHRFVCRLLGIRVRVTGAPAAIARCCSSPITRPGWTSRSSPRSRRSSSSRRAKSRAGRSSACSAKLQRTVFVDRDRRQETGEVNARSRNACRRRSGALFAEGTAGDGNKVLPFRSALVGAAQDAIASADDSSLRAAGRDRLSEPARAAARPPASSARRLVRQDELTDHIGSIIRTGAVDVSVTWGEPIAVRRRNRPQDLGPSAGIGRAEHDRAALRGPAVACGASRAFHLAAKGAKTAPIAGNPGQFYQESGMS